MVNWSAIDTVLLDMDGTLLDLRFDNFFWLDYLPRRYADLRGISVEAATARLQAFSDSLHGTLNWYCVDYWSDELGIDVEAIKREVQDQVRFRPGAEAFMRYLHERHMRCILVTNAHPKVLELKLLASGLGQYLHARYSTHTFQVAKENPGFWPQLQQVAGLDFHRCLFIDDTTVVLRRAREDGLQHLLQVLQPDTSQPVRSAGEFAGFVHFSEIMTP